jgi:beta-glucosidase
MAASWSPDSVYRWSSAIAKEFREKGQQALIGPNLNLARVPNGGRNHEFLSGEDPYLGYVLS